MVDKQKLGIYFWPVHASPDERNPGAEAETPGPERFVRHPKGFPLKDNGRFELLFLPLKNTFLGGNMGYMSVKDENFPRAWSFKG